MTYTFPIPRSNSFLVTARKPNIWANGWIDGLTNGDGRTDKHSETGIPLLLSRCDYKKVTMLGNK